MSGYKHTHEVNIYYEDTDFTGAVYHANYLKYFERAREHILGIDGLVKLYQEEGVGFVVYKANLTYKEPAKHGDRLEIRTTVTAESEYRLLFEQLAFRKSTGKELVQGYLELVCVNKENKLVKVPAQLLQMFKQV